MGGTFFTILLSLYMVFGVLLYEMRWFVFIDELFAFAIAGYACTMVVLRKLPPSKPLMIWMSVAIFYFGYSVLIHSNANIAIFNDFVMQCKPYMLFFGLWCIKPRMTRTHMMFLSIMCIFCAIVLPFIYYLYPHVNEGTTVGELLSGASFACVSVILGLMFYLCTGSDSTAAKAISLFIMLLGFLAPTSRYLGNLFFAFIIMAFVRKPIKINLKSGIMLGVVLVVMFLIVWSDIEFYFLRGYDEQAARALLYMHMPEVLNDYIPFGSGFATYANAASATWYSSLYERYGLDSVWGFVEGDARFISDTYYPVLAQFGYVGIALFIAFLVYIFKQINRTYGQTHDIKRYKTSMIVMAMILIESTSGSTFINEQGVLLVTILVLSLYEYRPRPIRRPVEMFGLKFLSVDKTRPEEKQYKGNENTDSEPDTIHTGV